jgi:hypothetical protein
MSSRVSYQVACYGKYMASAKNRLHLTITVVGIVVGGILAVVTGGDAFALAIATGGVTGVSYWVGALAQHRHHKSNR